MFPVPLRNAILRAVMAYEVAKQVSKRGRTKKLPTSCSTISCGSKKGAMQIDKVHLKYDNLEVILKSKKYMGPCCTMRR